ncbi:endonuclease G [Friedmanniella luteola]|uniref:Endonuclease G n=1 Tax=Friedmanniella luteola TaxID=546871 RepID=A0A1H1WW98_9ACTN|nr:DNA/RNA non-specific endonuclease [Friedmanniella luteola]SDT01427.1 endonuclease G [Friedmanniella luteola]
MAAVEGYDSDFLPTSVPLPAPSDGVESVRLLPFTHFSVVLELSRRLAVVTGVNIDGARLVEVDRGDDWHLDPRVPADLQCGPEVYAGNDLDRGHLVRRRDPVWGDQDTARQANLDSFAYVNAAPQAALFNQGELLWAGLEDYLLDHARAQEQRLSVFTAPVLDADDPPYRGIRIPRRFWKIAAWTTTATTSDTGTDGDQQVLAATGYLLDQSPQLDRIDLSDRQPATYTGPPPLGAYLTYQVPIVDLAALTGLDLGPLPTADRLPAPAHTVTGQSRWRHLRTLSDQILQVGDAGRPVLW